LALIIPFALNIALKEKVITDEVRAIYDRIESLPPNSRVLMSMDFDAASRPELRPMAMSLARHLAVRGHRIYFTALWPLGPAETQLIVQRLFPPASGGINPDAEFAEFEYGTNYVILGYRVGGQAVIRSILADLGGIYSADVNGTPIGEIPMMRGVNNLRDMNMILSMSAGVPGITEWIQFGADPSGVPVAGGVTSVTAPGMYPYYPGQLFGLLGGLKAAAEYETLLMEGFPERFPDFEPFIAVKWMAAQTFTHVVIMLFIIIGNVAYFVLRRRGGDALLKASQR
jgi:hypothetical protein